MDNNKKDKKGFKEQDPSKYINTEPTIDEAASGKTAVITFGRMNPMTVGHEKLVNELIRNASARKAAVPMVYLSHSQDGIKNPLSYQDKIKFAKQAFGNVIKQSKARTIIDVMKELNGKYQHIVVVVGSDRAGEFNTLLNKYNGKDYNYQSIKIESAGHRDPDSEGVAGMSASKMRGYAKDSDIKNFKKGLPKKLQKNAEEVLNAVRRAMNITEQLDEALSRAGRRKRAMAMRRARAKIKLGREKAKRRRASMDVLKKRARKRAIGLLKQKFSKHKRYADLSPAEKEQVEKRIAKINKQRIERMAQKQLIYVKRADRDKFLAKKEDTEVLSFKTFITEGPDYYKGLSKSTADKRKAHFNKGSKMDDDNPRAYKPAPGDARAETKPSKHTKKFAAMYGESNEWVCGKCHAEPCICGDLTEASYKDMRVLAKPHMLLDRNKKPKLDRRFKMFKKQAVTEDKGHFDLNGVVELMEATEGYILDENKEALKKKAEKSGMPYSILKKVYDRGVAAWRTGHKPGTTPQQWGLARVNSFATKSSGTWGKADSDLAAKVRKESVELEEDYRITKIYNPTTKASRAAKKSTATYAVHTKDRKYFKEFPSQKEAEAHIKSLGKKEKNETLDDAFEAFLDEKLKASDDMGKWIDDFQKSDAPQFKGKSKDKRRQMAIAAKLSANEETEIDELSMSLKDLTKSGVGNVSKAMKADKTKKELEALKKRLKQNETAGEEGTDELVKKFKKDTPNA